ncbi:MAG TPA: hypothetical protein VLF18_00710 [Tahibacter sp.]|uniref:hypothetical protein n=1 Tax=Tahibacter sp. TaxID=2056211 RepID=UPI002B853BA2|nr:hypothetical protein [Tahibacter sp.]HSX58694.1 hypothetical protein [Tahibacter sp.]
MLRNRFVLILLLPILLLLAGWREAPLVNPDPIAIPPKTPSAEVAKIVKKALVGRKWVVSEDKPGAIKATLLVRDHKARIAIDWNAKDIRISYIDSENLNFMEKDGKKLIHQNYNSWINNLVVDISGELTLLGT